MKFTYSGDPRSDDNQPTATVVSRTDPTRLYHFVLGEACDVHEDDVEQFEGNSHFKAGSPPPKKKAAKKKASKKKK